MKDKKIKELKNLVETAEIALQQARSILAEISDDASFAASVAYKSDLRESDQEEGKVVEGVFDGQEMVGPDGKQYSIPVNYASKSKLVEGDILKLTIKADGSFVYKQIGPQDRDRIKGKIVHDNESDEFRVMTEDGKSYRVLTASVTYYKGEPGDEAVILVPKSGEATWAALENIVKGGSASDMEGALGDIGTPEVKPDEGAEVEKEAVEDVEEKESILDKTLAVNDAEKPFSLDDFEVVEDDTDKL